jgi:hypothetical protein
MSEEKIEFDTKLNGEDTVKDLMESMIASDTDKVEVEVIKTYAHYSTIELSLDDLDKYNKDYTISRSLYDHDDYPRMNNMDSVGDMEMLDEPTINIGVIIYDVVE